MCAVYIMPRIAKKTTEKLRKKAIRRKSLRQKKRTMKKKNNARRTRRNMRKRNKRGGAAAEEEEAEAESAPTTASEFQEAIESFKSEFKTDEEKRIVGMIMAQKNDTISITDERGIRQTINVLEFIKRNLRTMHANTDALMNDYLVAKLKISIAQFEQNPKMYIITNAASRQANVAAEVREAKQDLTKRDLEDLKNIISNRTEDIKKDVDALKTRLGQADIALSSPEQMYDWARFVAGCAMVTSGTNEGCILGLLTILHSNIDNTILSREEGPEERPLKDIALGILDSQREKYEAIFKQQSINFREYIENNGRISNIVRMGNKIKEVVGEFLRFVLKIEYADFPSHPSNHSEFKRYQKNKRLSKNSRREYYSEGHQSNSNSNNEGNPITTNKMKKHLQKKLRAEY